MSFREKMMERKRQEHLDGIAERIEKGYTQMKDGRHIFASKADKEGKRRVTTVGRTVQSRLNTPNILGSLIRDNNFALSLGGYENFRLGIINLVQHIPDEEADEEFWKQVKDSEIVYKIPTGTYAGFGSQTFEIMKEVVDYDPFALANAVWNLLRRRGLTTTPKLWDSTRVGVMFTRQGINKPVERKKRGE